MYLLLYIYTSNKEFLPNYLQELCYNYIIIPILHYHYKYIYFINKYHLTCTCLTVFFINFFQNLCIVFIQLEFFLKNKLFLLLLEASGNSILHIHIHFNLIHFIYNIYIFSFSGGILNLCVIFCQ